jgi:uncharacterized repeat protein (TIGR02543 family)/LPXTG-motif cell wall-anchored protein
MSQGRHRARRFPRRLGAVVTALTLSAGLLLAAAPVQAAPAHLVLFGPAYALSYGDALNVEAILDAAPGGGTIAFYADGTPLPACTAVPLDSNGVSAYCRDRSLTPGSYTITAMFSGYGGSGPLASDGPVSVTIHRSSTTLVNTTASPVAVGVPFAATATLTDGQSRPLAGQTVTFDLSSGGTCTGTTGTDGSASCALTPTVIGTPGVNAVFVGDPLYIGSGQTKTITVAGADPGLTLPTTNVPWGSTATITATVKPAATGSIYFQGPCSVLATIVAGKATCTASFPTVGSSVLSAQYSGDSTYAMADTTAMVNVTQHSLSAALPTIQPALKAGVSSTVTVKLTDATMPGTTVDATPFTFALDGQSCSGTTSWSTATSQAIGTCQLTPSRSGTFSTTLAVSSTAKFNDLTQTQSMAVADNPHTVTFDGNGGTSTTSQSVTYNGTATKPADPTRTGYTFTGWYDGATPYDFTTAVTADVTLTAHWSAIAYTVTFVSAGGSAVASESADYGTTYAKPADPTRTGYTFAGWFTGGSAYDFATPITGNLTLTAHWQVATYTVTFDSAGGSAVADGHADYQTTYAAPSDPTRADHVFLGWYDGATPYDFTTAVTGDVTLTAHWMAVAVDAGLADDRVTTPAGTPVSITPTLTTATGTWPVPAGGWSATTGDRALTLSVDANTGKVTARTTLVGTYTLALHSAVGDATATVTVIVTPGPLARLSLKASDKTPQRGDTITLTTTGADAWGNSLGDVTAQSTFTSSMKSDTVRGNKVTFHHASPHVLTAHGPNGTTASTTVHVAPTAAHHDSSSTSTSGTLPATGSSISPYWPIAGGAALLLGLVLTLLGARRRS